MKTARTISLLIFVLLLTGPTAALALPATLSYTADNVMVQGWVFRGGILDDQFAAGPNGGDWRLADTQTIGLDPGQTYEIIWQAVNADENGQPPGRGNPGGFLGQVSLGNGMDLLSSSSWEVALLEGDLQTQGPIDFGTLGWVGATEYGSNGDPAIWNTVLGGPVAGIDEDASWIWWEDNFGDPGAPGANDSVFIRTTFEAPTPTPEPGTMFLLGSGLIGLAAFRKRMT